MTESDELFLTAAKLREQSRGDLDGDRRLHPHAGLVGDRADRAALSFIEDAIADSPEFDAMEFADTRLGEVVTAKMMTDEATEAVHSADGATMSHIVGVTEQDLDGSALRLPMKLLDALDNNDAPAFVVGAGNPNTGKTNTMALLAELRKADRDDLLVLSNIRSWELTDVAVTSAHDLMVQLLEHCDRPKFVVVDEASTHFDARTYRREVATQWTPLAKRFAKIGVDVCGLICHSGKDLHPEAKRLSTLPYFKREKKVVDFFERWPADADMPADQVFGGSVEELEPTGTEYDPDDAAPWSWNLEAELFSLDLGWSELLDELRERGSVQ
jgi:hypothetical protein